MTGIATWPRGCSKPTCGASTRAQTHRMPEPGRSAAVLDLLDRLGPEIVVVDVDILGSYRRDHAAFADAGERSMVPSVRTEDVDIDDDDLGAESVHAIGLRERLPGQHLARLRRRDLRRGARERPRLRLPDVLPADELGRVHQSARGVLNPGSQS